MNDLSEREAALAARDADLEGRVRGRYRCIRCGMRSDSALEARMCCRQLASAEALLKSRPRRFPRD